MINALHTVGPDISCCHQHADIGGERNSQGLCELPTIFLNYKWNMEIIQNGRFCGASWISVHCSDLTHNPVVSWLRS